MKKLIAIIGFTFLLMISIVPNYSFAQQAGPTTLNYSGWVQCDGVVTSSEQDRQTPCNFTNLIKMVNYLINWLFMISLPVIVGIIAYAGFKMMTGTQDALKKGKEMLWNAILGFVIMLTAWFIVSTVLSWILDSSFMSAATAIIGK